MHTAPRHHPNIYPTPRGYLARISRGGRDRSRTFTELKDAIKWRDSFGPPGTNRIHTPGEEEHQRQLALLPEGTSLRNVIRKPNGYVVQLRRGKTDIYGGLFGGPDALIRAVTKRDELEAQYPTTR